jgi:hypothetical protein
MAGQHLDPWEESHSHRQWQQPPPTPAGKPAAPKRHSRRGRCAGLIAISVLVGAGALVLLLAIAGAISGG